MTSSSESEGMQVSACGGGCFACRASKVSVSESAMGSSEHARRTSPLKSPSSSSRAARDLRGLVWMGLGLVRAAFQEVVDQLHP